MSLIVHAAHQCTRMIVCLYAYRYNIQCPSESFNLYYTMVQFSVEPPDANSKCLDFMRMLTESLLL